MSFSPRQEAPVVSRLRPTRQRCQSDGCDGYVVRHSLGCGQSVYRCSRCFRRAETAVPALAAPGLLRRFVDDFISWREDRN